LGESNFFNHKILTKNKPKKYKVDNKLTSCLSYF